LPKSGSPPPDTGVPPPVLALADGDPITPVWINELGGITFAIGPGGQRRFVKWAPAGSGPDLAAEAARLRWAVRYIPVPRLLGERADQTGTWIVTRALPGQMAVAERWTCRER
jgi:kanamycin kinase